MTEPRVLRISGAAQRVHSDVHLAEASPGEARFLWFALGQPEMDEEDWRQFEITPENAAKMVEQANAALAQKEIWVNYAHDAYGPRAGDAVRFEVGPDGGVYGVVRWNEAARSAIKQDPPVWKYFSPEFYASEVLDEKGRAKVVNGRQVLQPFEISGGGLTNTPAMVKLVVTASASRGGPPATPSPLEASPRKEQEMHISPENLALLGLAADATEEKINAAMAERLKAPPDHEAHAAAAARAIDEVVNRRLAEELAKRDHAAKVERAVDDAVKAGKVTVAQRPAALAFAKADLASFEAFAAAAPRVVPVVPVISGTPASLEVGAFAAIDPLDRDQNEQLMSAARQIAAAEGITVMAAAERLTKKGA